MVTSRQQGPGESRGDRLRVERREGVDVPRWEFVQPRCARRRREDLEEVEAMLAAGEVDVARDELVWLLSECPDFIDAHVHLGLLALEEDDCRLARGHFGRAYQLCIDALDAAGRPQPVPHDLPGNRAFHEAAKGLVHCLLRTGRAGMARDVCRRMAPLDPADPLGIQRLRRDARS